MKVAQRKKAFAALLSAFAALTLLAFSIDALANAASPTDSAAKSLAIKSGKVEFLAIGKPSFLKVRGVGTAPTGELKLSGTKASGEFTFDLSSLDTEIALRNEHMKDKYLEVGKFPKATIRFKDVETKEGAKSAIPAELELHGIKKTVSMDAELKPEGETKKATGTFKLKLTDFGITIPSHLGVTIADEVTVTIESVLK
ncbi:MAG: YceI family protein [Deltaproteobacteria bacterium]|jgi:polyisoprenoid-binding protein YceI|nr:YceI family protein [Deltaproteobacteria bacterium]